MEPVSADLLHLMKSTHTVKFGKQKRMVKKTKAFSDVFLYFLNERKTQNISIGFFIELLEKYLICLEFMKFNHGFVGIIEGHIDDLKRNYTNKKQCDIIFKQLKYTIDKIDKDLRAKACLLTCYEAKRLDESLNNYLISGFHPSIIMAVVAVESRLHTLIRKKNKKIYQKHFENATLGQIIKLFSGEEYKEPKFQPLKKILPLEYKPFIDILNQFRIFSAHPKGKELNRQECATILNLSFSILLDQRLKIEEKLRFCN